MGANKNRETLRQHLAAEARHDATAAAATYVDDCYYENVPLGLRFVGREQVAMQYAASYMAMPDSDAVYEGELLDGNHVAQWGTIKATVTGPFLGQAPTGGSINLPFTAIIEFADGKMRGERIFFDLASLCEQAGISITDARAAADALRAGLRTSPADGAGPREDATTLNPTRKAP
jgi:steroid delta-isomerase-like uncharacterized protein